MMCSNKQMWVHLTLKTKFSNLDDKYYQLPDRIKCDGKYRPEDLLASNKPEQHMQTTDIILKRFQDQILVWDIKDEFQFNLPPSYFNAKIEFKDNQNQIQKQIDQRELTWQNIDQLFQTGTLTIPSANFPLPFVWKISGWILKGRENISKSYYDDLSTAYYLFRQSYKRIYHKSDYQMYGGNFTIRAGILNILIKSVLYISMVIGFRETNRATNMNGAALKLEDDRQRKLKKEGKFSKALYKFLTSSKENSEKLKNYGQQFQKIAEGIKVQVDNLVKLKNEKKIFQQEDEGLELNDQARQELELPEDYLKQYNLKFDPNQNADKQINDFQFKAEKTYWLNIKAIPKEVIQNIIDISECKRIYEYHYSIYQKSIDNIANQFKTELQINHPIKGRIKDYVSEQMESYMDPIKLQLQTEMEANILNELKELQLIDRFVYQDYLEFKKEFEHKCQQIFELDRKYFNININKSCFSPYDVVKRNNGYELVRENCYKIPTKYPFWKLYLGIFVYYTTTSDIINFFYHHAIYGQLGLNVFFGKGVFYSDVKVDSQTGVVGPSGKQIKTISYHLKEVDEDIITSRKNFELQPDNGFCSKSILRIFNLMEVYLYRFLFIGVFSISICYPLLIFINVCISLFLGLTSLVYVPILLIIYHIFTLLIFDIHYEDENLGQEYQSILHYDACLPLITNTLRLVFQGVLQLVFAILFGFVIFPLLSVLAVVFAHIRYFLASLQDIFIISIISCFGKVPTEDSFLAWRISGPGITQQCYNQLSIENVLLLIAVEIEKVILINYKDDIKSSINDPTIDINEQITSQFPDVSFCDTGCFKLKQQMNQQLEAQKNNYPIFDKNLKVRYTEQELKYLFAQIKQFLQSQVIIKNQWEYLFYYYHLQEGDYDALAKEMVTDVLGEQVFEPIPENELKFILYDSKDQDLLIQQALEGQVDFKMLDKKYDVVAEQPINFKKFVSFENVITEIKNCQSQKQSWSSVQADQGFYINYALK